MSAGGMLGGASGAGGVLVLYLLARQVFECRLVRSQTRQVAALINLRPLSGSLPLDLGGWAADPVSADVVLRLVCSSGAQRVVECGSGWSTMLVASCLREAGGGRIVAFEHSEIFADRTRALQLYGASEHAEVVHAPLECRFVDGQKRLWYGQTAETAVDGYIDLLVVDGPPGAIAERSRYPAVPLLRDRLAPTCVIVLDDGLRVDEAWIAQEWGRQLGVEPRLIPDGKGVWVLSMANG